MACRNCIVKLLVQVISPGDDPLSLLGLYILSCRICHGGRTSFNYSYIVLWFVDVSVLANTSYTFLELLQIHLVITVELRMQAFLNITATMSREGLIARFWVQTLTPPVSLLYSQSYLFLYCLRPALKWALWVQGVCFHVECPCVVKPASNITKPLSSLAFLKNLSDLCALWHIVPIHAAPVWSYRSLMCMSEWVAWISLCLWSLESQVE